MKKIYTKLSSTVPQSLFIDAGLGHGFISYEDDTTMTYLLNSTYKPDFEHKILPTDELLNINWSLEKNDYSKFIISQEDKFAPSFYEKQIKGLLPKV